MKIEKAKPGTRVRLTGAFLRSTGQIAGGEGGKRWTVVECSCKLCQGNPGPKCQDKGAWCFVAVDEPHACQIDPTGYEDVPEAERPKFRHINANNLEACR